MCKTNLLISFTVSGPDYKPWKVPFHHPLVWFFKCSKIHQNIQKIYSSIQISSKSSENQFPFQNLQPRPVVCFPTSSRRPHRLHWNCPRCPITHRWSAHLKQEVFWRGESLHLWIHQSMEGLFYEGYLRSIKNRLILYSKSIEWIHHSYVGISEG